jgi:hypothetical protein
MNQLSFDWKNIDNVENKRSTTIYAINLSFIPAAELQQYLYKDL